MADVFISYHEASAGELAEEIADRLEDAGISCWCARRNLPFGGDFARVIPAQIDNCKVFLLLLNENVYHSDHIENEVGLAFSRRNKARNIQILPLEIGDFTRKDWIRYYLIHTQSDKFPENPDEQRIQTLVKWIARLLGKEPAPQQKPKLSPPPTKIVKRGKCGNSVNFTLDENGVLAIFGTGPMWDFEWDDKTKTINTPWWYECKTISHVEIQHGVTTIGKWAFDRCTGLTSVAIPDSVTTIEVSAFGFCESLTSVTIPGNVTTIGDFSFHLCTGLTSVTISNGVITIGVLAFAATGLTSVAIPDSVTTIGQAAFYGCDNLTSVSVPARVKIADDAFDPRARVTRRE